MFSITPQNASTLHALLGEQRKSSKFMTTSRSIRRFMEHHQLSPSVQLALANDSGYSPSQIEKLIEHAASIHEYLTAGYRRSTLAGPGVVSKKKTGFVALRYELNGSWDTASLSSLVQDFSSYIEFTQLVADFADNKGLAVRLKDYIFRGLQKTHSGDGLFWSVSGTDKRTGTTGVLEWCASPADVEERLALMQKHRFRFTDLESGQQLAA